MLVRNWKMPVRVFGIYRWFRWIPRQPSGLQYIYAKRYIRQSCSTSFLRQIDTGVANSPTDKGSVKAKDGETPNPTTVTVAPRDQLGLLVTDELEKAMEECRTKVAQIVEGCRVANRRFRDIEFDLENDKIRCLSALNYHGSLIPPAVLRVTQIFEHPQFFIDGAEAIDIVQGHLGNCWFLSALSTMSTSKGLIEKLCVARDEEVGVYGFVFFQSSTWVSVIIDDQLFWSLPKYEELSSQEQALYRCDRDTYNKLARKGGKGLCFARSATEGETWVPLIEKAYAKLHGDYESLVGGYPSEAIEDMTGGVSVMYRNKDILDRDRFWKEELLHATEDRLFSCSFDELDTSRKKEPILEHSRVNGLLGSHAYSILRVKECKGKRFVVIRNPWGASEWTGAWGDGSKEWVGEWLDVLKELDHVFGDDGEFVMEYSDFLDTFELIERTTIFDSSWVMSSLWLQVPPQKPNSPWTFGDLSWNIDFVVYKRGDREITGVSFYAVVTARSVTCEINLEAGEYVIFPRYDRYSYKSPGYFEAQRSEWDKRKLTRVLTERAKARFVAVNMTEGADNMYLPTPIEALIENDLRNLELEQQQVVSIEDGETQEAQEEPKEAISNAAKGVTEQPEKPPDGEDSDPITLGVRIYTKGGAVVSVTGQVIG